MVAPTKNNNEPLCTEHYIFVYFIQSEILLGKTILEDISDDDEDQEEPEDKTEPNSKKMEEQLSRLQNALDRAKNSIAFLKERERKLKDR